jgi:iron complex outermembrane receptor protein
MRTSRAPVRAALSLTFACSTVFACSAVFAADESDPVVVSASRFPERALAVPVGVRIITANDIEGSAARTLPEILGQLGGLHIRNSTGSPDQQLDLRGFGITGDQNTLVLVDGVRISEIDLAAPQLSAIPLQAIERIEILPGGGAVQYGSGATGGTVNIITRTPQPNTLSGTVFGGYGTFQTTDFRAGVNAAGDQLGLALYGNAYDTDNYRDNNEHRQRNLFGNLRYAAGDGSIGVRFGVNDQKLRFPGALSEAQIAVDPRQAATPNDFSNLQGEFAVVHGDYRLGSVDFAGDFAYRDTLTGAFFDDAFFPIFVERRTRTRQFSPRFRWHLAPAGIASQLVGGFDWFDADSTRKNAESEFALIAPFGQTEATQRSAAGWLQVLSQLTERTRVNIGGRLARVENELATLIPGLSIPQTQSRTLSAFEAALRYALTPELALSGRIGKSFRVATVDENGFTPTGNLLEPQTARQGELGLDFRAGAFSARATYYLIRLQNEIYFVPLIPPFGFNTNLSPTERKGWEFAARWLPLATLDLAASLNLQEAKFREGVYGGVDVTGNDVPLVPNVLANLRASWTFLPRTRLSASYTYVGEQRYDNDQANMFPRKMPSYGLVDLKLAHDIGKTLTLAASVANLFDEGYYSYGTRNFAGTSFNAYPQAGRTFFASAEVRFR